MEFPKELFKEVLTQYLNDNIRQLLPELLTLAEQQTKPEPQDLLPIDEIVKRFTLSKKTLYNYHHKKYITLYSSERKTFVSLQELQAHIRAHPVARLEPANLHQSPAG